MLKLQKDAVIILQKAAADTGNFTVQFFDSRDKWLNSRRKGLGGSDIAAIIGASKYSTPYDVYKSKVEPAEEEPNSLSYSQRKGNALEALLREDFANNFSDYDVYDTTGYHLINTKQPILMASLDGLIVDRKTGEYGILECKTARADYRGDWVDDEGFDTIPDYYYTQVQHYLAVTGFTFGFVVVDYGHGVVTIPFKRDEDIIASITNNAETFWNDYVAEANPPTYDLRDVQKVYAHSSKPAVEVDDKQRQDFDFLCAQRQELKEQIKKLNNSVNDVENHIKAIIGNHEAMSSAMYKASWKTTKSKGYTVEPKEYRSFRVSKVKAK